MAGMAKLDYIAILRALTEHRVDFIIVGGVGAVLQGAPIMTFDLEIVHSTDEANIERLLTTLESLDARYRIRPERKLRPQASHLRSSGHQLLMTRHGPLDLLGAIGHGHAYAELIHQTVSLQVADDLAVRVLELASLIAIKEETAAEKDEAVLPILRQTLRERE
jgi:hypothetical protein